MFPNFYEKVTLIDMNFGQKSMFLFMSNSFYESWKEAFDLPPCALIKVWETKNHEHALINKLMIK